MLILADNKPPWQARREVARQVKTVFVNQPFKLASREVSLHSRACAHGEGSR
jgi:hypothetical protein